MPVLRGEARGGQASGPARFLSLFRRMRSDADPARLVHTAGDEPPSPRAPHDVTDEPDFEYDSDGDRLRASREDNPFLRRLSEERLDREGAISAEPAPGRRRTSSAGAGDQRSHVELHARLVRSPPPSRSRRRASPALFEIHEKAKIVVIPTSQLRPLRTRQREDVMDRSLQYILRTQQALPVSRDLSADRTLSRRLSGATAPPLAPRAISALSVRSGRQPTERACTDPPAATTALSAGFESRDALPAENSRGKSRYSLNNPPAASPQPSFGNISVTSASPRSVKSLNARLS